jgi:hypothetical protein
MTNPAAKKRLTLVAAIVAVAIISVAVFAQFGGRTISPVESSTTLPSSAASSTQTRSTSTPSSSGMTSLSIGFGQSNPALVSTPSITMNYTLVINQLNTSSTANQVALSATSTVPGVTLSISPNQFTFLGTQEAVLFEISVAPTVNSSILPVEITARTANGATSSTFDFRLDKALVVVTGVGLTPPTLHANAGQAVNWLDLVEVDDDGNGYVNIMLKDGSAASPTMGLYDAWSHKFDRPGTYTYQVTVYSHTLSGVVVVA